MKHVERQCIIEVDFLFGWAVPYQEFVQLVIVYLFVIVLEVRLTWYFWHFAVKVNAVYFKLKVSCFDCDEQVTFLSDVGTDNSDAIFVQFELQDVVGVEGV